MDIGYNESLVDDRLPTASAGGKAGYRFADRYVLGEGRRRHEHLFTPRAGRFVQLVLRGLDGPVRIHRFEPRLRVHTTRPIGRFCCSDLDLDLLYEAGSRTLALCMTDVYMDCPWREQAFWLGDFHAEALFESYTFGDGAVTRQCLEIASHGMTDRGLLAAVYPSDRTCVIPGFSLHWLLALENYVRHTGDYRAVPPLFDTVTRLMETFEAQRSRNGLLDDFEDAWSFYDWGFRFGGGQCALLTLLHVGALKAAAELAYRLGKADLEGEYRRRAERGAGAVNGLLWDEAAGAYRDGVLRDGALAPGLSQHPTALALYFGAVPPERREACLDTLVRLDAEDRVTEPFYQLFVLDALARHGRMETVVDILRRRFSPMLEAKTGTLWEMWRGKSGGEGPTCYSLCHAWSASPLLLFPGRVLGVEPIEDGYHVFRCSPRTGGIEFAQGLVPTPNGPVQVSWVDRPDRLSVSLSVPFESGMTCEFVPPFETKRMTIHDAARRPYRAYYPVTRLGEGAYTILIDKPSPGAP